MSALYSPIFPRILGQVFQSRAPAGLTHELKINDPYTIWKSPIMAVLPAAKCVHWLRNTIFAFLQQMLLQGAWLIISTRTISWDIFNFARAIPFLDI